MDNVLCGHSTKTQDVDTFFGSEKINEGVLLLGKGVGCSSCLQGSGPFKKTVPLELNR